MKLIFGLFAPLSSFSDSNSRRFLLCPTVWFSLDAVNCDYCPATVVCTTAHTHTLRHTDAGQLPEMGREKGNCQAGQVREGRLTCVKAKCRPSLPQHHHHHHQHFAFNSLPLVCLNRGAHQYKLGSLRCLLAHYFPSSPSLLICLTVHPLSLLCRSRAAPVAGLSVAVLANQTDRKTVKKSAVIMFS